jgi:hypothetical protein
LISHCGLIADDSHSYVQFAPIAYIVKLHIELNNAILISKIVRGSSHRVDNHHDSSTDRRIHGTHISVVGNSPSAQHLHTYFPGKDDKRTDARVENGDVKSSFSSNDRYQGDGIQKTVTMFISDDSKGHP